MMKLRFLPLLLVLATIRSFAQEAPPAGVATPAEALTVLPGFKVELLKSATAQEGSWVCMAIDDQGRLYISPQNKTPDGGIMRVTLDAAGHVAKTDWLKADVSGAMGMLWAFDSLYVSGQGPDGTAIYRLRDTDGDDTLDEMKLFKKVPNGGGEHGAHALVLGPDKKSIYIVHGNSTALVDGIAPDSPYKNYAEDDLLPRVMDPVATFFDKIKSPYGYVLKTDENGTKWELIAGGFRNPYDIDFNEDGALFTYDSDMEWDVALPWYRPTRVLHVVPGGEYGFREGSAKWPAWYPDSLPAAVNIGLGSPTGVKFGTRSNFPPNYKSAFFIMDWTFGRILAVHLQKDGPTYTASNPLPSLHNLTSPASSPDVEEFVKGKGLPVTDLEFGKDGAMYFTIGGRGTQAGLYRVSYVGPQDAPEILPLPPIESPSKQVANFTARLRAENLPLDALRKLVRAAPSTLSDDLNNLLALARVGTEEDQLPILEALGQLDMSDATEPLQLRALRVLEVTFARQGRPDTDVVRAIIEKLSPAYPTSSFALNRELVQILVFLGDPEVAGKTLTLMNEAADPAEQIWYALCLREASGWTPAQREEYFKWFAKARGYRGGNSFGKFILRIRDQALAKLPEAERPALLALAEKKLEPARPAFAMPERPFVKMWTLADLEPALPGVAKGRNFARGKQLYAETLCSQCHLFAGTGGSAKGGAIGPDLTAVGSRFNARDILDSILEPSKVISEQYQSFLFSMKDGSTLGGQIAEENHYLITITLDPLNGTKQNFPLRDLLKREVSPVSLMPPGLLATLTQEEVLDLLAYLQSGGDSTAPPFLPN